MYNSEHTLAAVASKPHTLIAGGADLQIELTDLFAACKDSPADVSFEFGVYRTTDVGTGGSALTPEKVSGHGVASQATVKGGTFSADPTKSGASLMPIVFNHRAAFRFPTDPRYPIRSKIASNNGLEVFCISTGSAGNVKAQPWWKEN